MSENESTGYSHPAFLSIEFHAKFFPALILGRVRGGEAAASSIFTSNLGLHLLLFASLILAVIGFPNAVSHGSAIGWAATAAGAAGVTAVFINSIWSFRGSHPSYDNFLKGIFLLFLSLGLSCGVFAGTLEHSFWEGLIVGLLGVVAGYTLGILAGLWLQYAGWLSPLISGMAGLLGLGMLFVDLVLLT